MRNYGDVTEPGRVRDIRRRYHVPDGVRLQADDREILAWLPGYEVAVREVAAHPDDLPFSRHGGRRLLRRLDSGPRPVLVREYSKGGMLRHVRGRAMHGPWRPLQELSLHRRLEALGVPVTHAVGCVILLGSVGWRGFLLVEEVEDGVDLEVVLHARGAPSARPLSEVLTRAGKAVRALHDAGVPHPDLHPKNLLVRSTGAVLLLDLDKAAPAEGRLDERVRFQNLLRLGRSIEKHRLKGLKTDGRLAMRFLEGYAGSRDAARLWLERIQHRLGRGLGARRLWWRLKGEARPWRPAGRGTV